MTPQRGNEWWDKWFLGMAQYISTASKDPSTKVGAVIVDKNNRSIAWGYNGFAKGVEDREDRLNDRNQKYPRTCHAEINAIVFSQKDLKDCTLFCYPFMPCSNCAAVIIQSGIKRVVAPLNNNQRWAESFSLTTDMFEEADVELCLYSDFE